MDKTKALQKLLNGTATKKEIELLKQALASGEISIGGDVNRSVVIIGSGNKVELTSEALNLLKPETTSEEPAEGEPPYMGLRYFDTSDADLFYGREALTRELLARVQKESFLAIVGASGSGKSSVARAGLILAWIKENERGAIHVITPTAHPLESLAASLTRESESVTATSTLMDDMNKDVRSLRLYMKKTLGETKLLLLVDQFEETFTLCKDTDERKAFIENLLSLADDDGPARVVITLRADFYAHCAEYDGLRQVLEEHQKYIGAMTPDELRQAITTPAQSAGWDFQPGLVDLILQDVGTEPGALPLLSHALLETWKRRQRHTLTLQGYADAGGVKKAIAQTAESTYNRLTPAEQTIARRIFLRLTELGEGVQDTRRRVKLDELAQSKEQGSVAKVLKILTDARLVTTEKDIVEAAHEALIREWDTLQKWLDEDRESLLLHRHLTESALEWKRRKREKGELYRGARLIQMQEWIKSHSDSLNPLETDFLKSSFAVLRREQNVARLLWIAFIVSSIVLAILLIFFIASGLSINLNRYVFKPVDINAYWVTIPAGNFQMGSVNSQDEAKPVHTVYLDAYQIGKYEVTNRQYYQCVQSGICLAPVNREYFLSERAFYPVSDVNWHDAQTYCSWVGGRLPTEAEWEKAARGGLEDKTYPWGNEEPTCLIGALNGANFAGESSKGCKTILTKKLTSNAMPVGSFAPNGYGLYDMAGNVWEWVSSLYLPYPYNAVDGREDMNSTDNRVLRGGSWLYDSNFMRTDYRFNYYPSETYFNTGFGFRCAHSLP